MRRFNQYINGEREHKFDPNAEVRVLSDEDAQIEIGKKSYEEYLQKINKEAVTLKSLSMTLISFY